MAEIKEGAAAPAFTLATADGPVSLSDYADRTLVFYFYPKDDTSGCTTEAQDFTRLASEFEAAGAAVLGVSKDSTQSHQKFAAKYGLTVRLGSDPDGDVIARYGSWVQKKLYGREYMGIDRSTFVIKGGSIARIWRKVKVPGHAQAVLEVVKTLLILGDNPQHPG